MKTRPNVIVLITHDTGRHISPYGVTTVTTPNCRRLADQSVLFENSFCAAPQCSPSRAALFTGRYPHANGVLGLAHGDYTWRLGPNEKPAAMLFGPAGYQTWLLGAMHETTDPLTLGFDAVDIAYSILEIPPMLKKVLDVRDRGRPFFAEICVFETHRPYDWRETPGDDSLGVTVPPYLHDGPETRAELAALQGNVRRFDQGLGQILDLLGAAGVLDNTILVVTTDHGLAMPMAKGTLRDPGLETFLMIRWPGAALSAGCRRREMISHVDILPTLLEAAGIARPGAIQGRSFLPLLAGGRYQPNDAIFAELTFHDRYDPMRAIRTSRHKYIQYFEKCARHSIPGDIQDQGACRELAASGVLARKSMVELFDLEADPLETTNLAEQPPCRNIAADLRHRLARWMRDTGDPLLSGPIASPYYHRSITRLLDET